MAFASIVNAKKSIVDADDRLKLICADVVEGLKTLDDNSIDITITSPPYNVNIPYDGHNDDMPMDDYWQWLQDVWTGVFKKTKDNGRICVNGPIQCFKPKKGLWVAKCLETLQNAGWQYMAIITWYKTNISNRTAWGSWASPSSPNCNNPEEIILVCFKGSATNPPNGREAIITPKEFIDYTTGQWGDICPESATRVGHPAPFPVELPKRCIKLFTYRGDTVLDPFNGSGSTGVAALQCGCKYVGIDISQKYLDISRERIYAELTEHNPTQQEKQQ